MSRLIGDAFVSYYERKSSVAREKWGETKLWPQSWRFGWAMRNACAHDGKNFFKNKDYSAVQWKSRRYDYADNGRQIFFDEIAGADLILLMEELDRCLKLQMQDE